jgi:GTPase Era involved in 16S rRNA processing
LKTVAKISGKLLGSTWQTLTVIAAIFGAGAWYVNHQQERDTEQQAKIINTIISQIKPELQVLKVDLAKVNLQLEFAKKRDTMQVNSFNRYRMTQAKSEREQIEIYKDIQKQLEQRQEYFYNEQIQVSPEQEYFDTIYQRWAPDTLKKKLNYRMTAQGS